MKKVKSKQIHECKYCGKQFFPRTTAAKYCSEDCRKTAQKERDRQKRQTKVCLRCNKPFDTPKYSSRWYCDDCKRRGKGSAKSGEIDREARAEKMRKIKESGVTYGRYTAGIREEEPAEWQGTIMHSQLSNRWDEKKPREEKTVKHPRARVKIHPSMLPPPPVIGKPGRRHADQDEKEPENAKEEIKEEKETAVAGHDLRKMLQAEQVL